MSSLLSPVRRFAGLAFHRYKERHDFMQSKMYIMGWTGMVGFILCYWLFTSWGGEVYETWPLRVGMSIISIPIALYAYWPRSLQPYQAHYSYFFFTIMSTFSIYITLMNGDNGLRYGASMYYLACMVLYVDRMNLIIQYMISLIAGCLIFALVNDGFVPSRGMKYLLLIHLFTIVTVFRMSFDSRALQKQKKKGALESLTYFAHEIRTPLNAIQGYARMAKSSITGKDKMLDRVIQSSERLEFIIDEAMEFWKSETEEIQLNMRSVSLYEIRDYIETVAGIHNIRDSVTVDIKIQKEDFTGFISDSSKIGQIVSNLVINALKFTREGRVEIALSAEKNEQGQCLLTVSIKDTGAGISEQDLATILQPFVKKEEGEEDLGIGLGLSIVKRFLAALGSEIHIESEKDSGSRFYFTLDVEEAEAVTERSDSDEHQNVFFPVSVLYCDDVPENTEIFRELMKDHFESVDTFESAREALIAAEKKEYGVIFTDIQMPDMNGYEFVEALRSNGNKSPVIAISAFDFDLISSNIDPLAIHGYVAKPFRKAHILATAGECIDRFTIHPEFVDVEYAQKELAYSDRLIEIVIRGFLEKTKDYRYLPEYFVTNRPEFCHILHDIKPFFHQMNMERALQFSEQLAESDVIETSDVFIAVQIIVQTRKECERILESRKAESEVSERPVNFVT